MNALKATMEQVMTQQQQIDGMQQMIMQGNVPMQQGTEGAMLPETSGVPAIAGGAPMPPNQGIPGGIPSEMQVPEGGEVSAEFPTSPEGTI